MPERYGEHAMAVRGFARGAVMQGMRKMETTNSSESNIDMVDAAS